MSTKRENHKSTASRLSFAGLAATAAVLVVMPIAWANGADDPVATKSAASLQKQVKSLKKRVAALEGRQTNGGATGTTATPVGPAGGDLTGTYPNPTIGPDKVTEAKIAPNAVGASEIIDGGIGVSDLGLTSVTADALAPSSVGDSEFKGVHSVIGAGTSVANNTAATVTVGCPAGEQLIAGGYAWGSNVSGLTVTDNAPSGNPGEFFTQWVVTGRNVSGSSVNLFPWASCLVN